MVYHHDDEEKLHLLGDLNFNLPWHLVALFIILIIIIIRMRMIFSADNQNYFFFFLSVFCLKLWIRLPGCFCLFGSFKLGLTLVIPGCPPCLKALPGRTPRAGFDCKPRSLAVAQPAHSIHHHHHRHNHHHRRCLHHRNHHHLRTWRQTGAWMGAACK